LMTPPGLTFVITSQAALEVAQKSPLPRFYLDWIPNLATQSRDEPETWFSAAVSLVVALEVALSSIRHEGLEAVYQRHARLGQLCRSGVKELGLKLFSPDDDSAAVLTAVRMPEGLDSTDVVREMHERCSVTAADGEARLRGKIVRIGHLGYVGEADVERAVAALGNVVAPAAPLSRTGVI
jgi:aspartate aminotransferase-like enzyme